MISDRFIPISKFNLNDIAKGSYYESTFSGLHVMVAEIDGPTIETYIGFGTKVEDNSGVAHTLEHLVFCGSKKYPYKGILDSLANRCFAQGTNAWTCIDSTVYTISTASQEGLMNILPVYLDHIFNPIITEETFATEVYSKNEQGEEGGVVFSEMQAKENLENTLIHMTMMKKLFQDESGYPFNSGGAMKYIRTLSVSKIVEFHKKFYRPENCLIAIVGSIDMNEILKSIIQIETQIFSNFPKESRIERPWLSNKVDSPMYGEYDVKFISQNKNIGTLVIVSPGPHRDNITQCQALNVIACYLTYFEKSPLKKQCVIEDKFCNDISYNLLWFDKTYLEIRFSHVEIENMQKIISIYKSVLRKLEEDGLEESFLSSVIQYEFSFEFNEFEKNTHYLIATRAIDYFLYGRTSINLIDIMERIRNYKEIFNENREFWDNMLKNYFIPENCCVIKSIPQQGSKLRKQETSIFEEEETEINEYHIKLHKRPPVELLDLFPVPSIESIKLHDIKTLCNFGSFTFDDVNLYDFDIYNIPLALQADHIQSNTLTVTLCICLGNFPQEIRHYIPLAIQFPLEMPILRNGVVLSHSECRKKLDMLFYHQFSTIGWNSGKFSLGMLPYYFFLSLKTDIFKYEEAVSWIKDLLFNNICDKERLKILILDDFKYAKSVIQSANGAVSGLSNYITFRKDSINNIQSVFSQIVDLQKLYQRLKNDEKTLLEELTGIQRSVRRNANIIGHVMCNFQKLNSVCKTPHSIWQLNFSENAAYDSKTPLTPSNYNYDQLEDKKFEKKIIGLTSETCYLIQTIPSIKSYRDDDFPGLMVLLEFLSAFEGPLWKSLRGKGLAYTAIIYCEPSDGLIYFKISKAVDIFQAYKEAINVFKSFADESRPFNDYELDSAISGAIFEIVNQETNTCDAGFNRLLAQLKGYDYEFHKDLIKRVSKICLEDLKNLSKKYFSSIVDPSKSHIAISCPQKDLQKIIDEFKTINIDFEIHQLPEINDELMTE